MAIYLKDQPHALQEEFEDKPCFLCGRSLLDDLEYSTGGFVYWMGAEAIIALHQPCAEHLAVQLIQDARSLITRTGTRAKLRHAPPAADTSWYVKEQRD